ncbi:GGDEF domain-containing protein [soil metagenome]
MTRRPLEDDTVSIAPLRGDRPSSARGLGEACIVIIYGPDLGRRIPLEHGKFEIGRSSKCDLELDQDSVSRHHARIERDRAAGFRVTDLGSTNGTYVNDVAVSDYTLLADGDRIKVGRSILKFMEGDNIEASYHEEIYRLMTIDGLTQLFNRRYFDETLEREANRCGRYNRPLSLVLLDIDHFKRKNDEFGHVAGDAVLRQLAQAVRTKLRREDIFARTGGEEFALVLPEVPLAGALITAEKVRETIEETAFLFDEHSIPCTVSLGATELRTGDGPVLIYKRADAALYQAKAAGRNRVVAA